MERGNGKERLRLSVEKGGLVGRLTPTESDWLGGNGRSEHEKTEKIEFPFFLIQWSNPRVKAQSIPLHSKYEPYNSKLRGIRSQRYCLGFYRSSSYLNSKYLF